MSDRRTHEVDGIRGWAALSVLLFHFFHETFGNLVPALRAPVVFMAINGPLAVYVFFILSGDALSIGYLRTGDRSALDSLVLRRYTRLMIPVALSCLAVYALMSAGLTFNKEAAVLVRRQGWLGAFLNFEPNIIGLLLYVLVGVFSPADVYVEPVTQYNPVLWTMSIELAGSALVFLFWYLAPGLRRQRGLLIGLVAVLSCLGSYYALFFFGMLMSRFRVDGVLQRFRASRGWQVLAPLLVVVAGYANAAHYEAGNIRQFNLLCAAVLVFCFYTSRPALVFFRSPASRLLGEISFPLYLIHFAVLVSYTSWWIVASGTITTVLAIEIAAISAFLSVVAAIAFRQVEKLALRPIDRRLNRLIAGRADRAGTVSAVPAEP